MTHRITTTAVHVFDLEPSEQFDETAGYRKTALRIDQIRATLVDGSLSSVRVFGAPILKSGEPGKVRSDLSLWRPYPEHVKALLRSRGIPAAS